MIHKLSTVSYNSLRNKGDATVSFDETSNADPPDFDRSSTSEEEPIEVTIERPWHTLSYFDKIWCYRKEHPERTKERGMPTEEPVLNIVWEQTPCRPSNMTSTTLQDSSEPQCVGKREKFVIFFNNYKIIMIYLLLFASDRSHTLFYGANIEGIVSFVSFVSTILQSTRELISCIPMTVKKPRQSGRGFVSEPVTLKVHLEPMEAADDVSFRLTVLSRMFLKICFQKCSDVLGKLRKCSHINLAAVNETSSSSESSTTNEACWNMNNASSVTKDESTTIMRSTSSTRAPTAKKNSLAIENRNFTAEPKIASAAKDEPVTKDVGTFSLTSDQELCKPDSN
uniref:GRAM domain-containing protein 1B n=1 Tax=Angiostrongylus cantonensis TaxID=6313 RepID=A0A0K0DDC6_ANGCA